MTDWQQIIRQAAYQRFCKTGDCGPFQLSRRDLVALCLQVSGVKLKREYFDTIVRVQARVYVPELQMQVNVDLWEGNERKPDGKHTGCPGPVHSTA